MKKFFKYTFIIDIRGIKYKVSYKFEIGYNEENNKVVHRERFYGSQSRSFYVGNIDQSQISANFNNGILEIAVPKEEMVEDKSNKYIDIK